MSDSSPTDVNISLDTPPISTSAIDADYTIEYVPNDIRDKVVNAGAKVGTGLEDGEARDRGLIKNHWTFRGLANFALGGQVKFRQVKFGMDIERSASIGSNEAQYARSSRSDPASSSDMAYSPISSVNKPPAPGSDELQPALPLVPATGDGSHRDSYDSYASQSVVNSDVESVRKPPDITSSHGVLFQQPTEGAPHAGAFNVKVRGRTEPSSSVVVVFELRPLDDFSYWSNWM